MKHRTEILAACLAAFSGISGALSEAEVDYGMSVIETEYGCDLDAVAAALRDELAACVLVCRVVEA
jgi:hypothetical protein